MTHLSVNINRIALLRNSRAVQLPDLARLTTLILAAGARGITIHPRPDERHIRADDVLPIAQLVARYPAAEYNIEGNPEHNLMPHLQAARPQQATFVPDSVAQATSDHGYSAHHLQTIAPLIAEAKRYAARVSVFVDADNTAIDAAKAHGADRIELYTEPYAVAAATGKDFAAVLAQFAKAARYARSLGLGVNAGHDLNQANLAAFIKAVAPDEVSIGHALISDALIDGISQTVRQYRALCEA
jgi:pyridoxine 5-phosphate synthase